MPEEERLPEHLGGHANITWHDEGAIDFFIKNFNIKSMIDVGCGPGMQTEIAQRKGLYAVGVDGDYTIKRNDDCKFQIHDYSTGPLDFENIKYKPKEGLFDLGWSIEFLEHVDEKYIPNFMETFKLCKFVVVTHAYPGQGGHHHVNEQEKEYWIKIFKKYGFKHSQKILNKVLSSSTMLKRNRKDRFSQQKRKMNWLDMNGSVFINRNF